MTNQAVTAAVSAKLTQSPSASAAPDSAPPRVLAASPVARLLLPAEDLFREEGDTFSVRFRVENLTDHSLYLDLASPTLVGPDRHGCAVVRGVLSGIDSDRGRGSRRRNGTCQRVLARAILNRISRLCL